jgi:hypothetical protein
MVMTAAFIEAAPSFQQSSKRRNYSNENAKAEKYAEKERITAVVATPDRPSPGITLVRVAWQKNLQSARKHNQ